MVNTNATLELAPGAGTPLVFTDAESQAIHACKILIIDDEEPNVLLLERVLARAGFDNFLSTTDSNEAVSLFADFQPDLVLTDWLMPGVGGCAVIEQLRAMTATDDFLPIVVLTADITPQTKKRALIAGATDFLIKPFEQFEVLLRIRNVLKSRLSHLVIQGQNAALEESVRQRTIQLERALSELKGAQRQVIQQERLAALGTMAGGIAHDFNNALSIIMGYSELLLNDLGRGLNKENATPQISAILTAAEDASTIVHRLREFYRPDETAEHRMPVDLNKIIKQSISLTQPRWQTASTAGGRTIVITTDLGDIPCVSGDAAELREVLTNLVFNAVDALPDGGTISLATRREGQTMTLKISDTGIGMSEEVRQRCLEPFFSTKGKRGTGLGLSMVFGIIRRHGGSIDIESEPGKGASFLLRLPASFAEIATGPDALPWSNGPLRILVVDDQPILCRLVRDHLEGDLHTVQTALSAGEALEKLGAAQFDLVITDHIMPEMNGEQLAIRIKELSPKMPVILLTGYQSDATAEKRYSEAIDLILEKPLSRAALRNAFTTVMTAT
ncbi:MAG: response regulator [Chthoniobacteraceae bacterium]|jgi:signal transduction histidine kinase